jgi:hypothetical protein
MAQHPGVKRVVALEGREANLRKARLVQELLGIRNVEFLQANLEDADLASLGKFDAVFCCGLLYHLPQPRTLLERLPTVAPVLFIWTQYASDHEARDLPGGLRGKIHVEGGPDEPLSGLSPTATWLTLDSRRLRLKDQNPFVVCAPEIGDDRSRDEAEARLPGNCTGENCPSLAIGGPTGLIGKEAQVEVACHDVIELLLLQNIGRLCPGHDNDVTCNALPFSRQNRQLANAKNIRVFGRVALEPVDCLDARIDVRKARPDITEAGPRKRSRE